MDSISLTACLTAAARAREHERPERLFADPFAAVLAGRAGFAYLDRTEIHRPGYSGTPNPYLAIRTRFFDDFLLTAVCTDKMHQVVLVGAGMDMRAFRLRWPPGIILYELDQPMVVSLKESLLADIGVDPICERHILAADLTQQWTAALCGVGYQPGAPSIWLVEGLLFYLDETSVRTLIGHITSLVAPQSRLGIDVVSLDLLQSPMFWPWLNTYANNGAPWRFGTNNPESLFTPQEWEVQVTQVGEDGANFGRWPFPVLPRTIPGVPRTFLITASRV
jgi:methyltransferase (TIGR00027 family)